jgi:pyruvate dehydrogenase phosphatase
MVAVVVVMAMAVVCIPTVVAASQPAAGVAAVSADDDYASDVVAADTDASPQNQRRSDTTVQSNTSDADDDKDVVAAGDETSTFESPSVEQRRLQREKHSEEVSRRVAQADADAAASRRHSVTRARDEAIVRQRQMLASALKAKSDRVKRTLLKQQLQVRKAAAAATTEEVESLEDGSKPEVARLPHKARQNLSLMEKMQARKLAAAEEERKRVGEPMLSLDSFIVIGVVSVTVLVLAVGLFLLRQRSSGVREIVFENKRHHKEAPRRVRNEIVEETDCASGDPSSSVVVAPEDCAVIRAYHVEHYGANIPIEDKYQAFVEPAGAVGRRESGEAFFAVYDGHGGPMAADFAVKNLQRCLKEALKAPGSTPAQALQRAFVATDNLFMDKCSELFKRGQRKAATVGTCALVALIRDGIVYVANVGDSRAVIATRDTVTGKYSATSMSIEHNARDPALQKELSDAHPGEPNIVVQKRNAYYVKGRLQLTRSIGDFYLKSQEFNTAPLPERSRVQGPYTPPYISGVAEVFERPIGDNDEYLLLASDGFWEVMTDGDAMRLLDAYSPAEHGDNPSSYLRRVAVERAAAEFNIGYGQIIRVPAGERRRDIHDDITIIVVNLGANSDEGCAEAQRPTRMSSLPRRCRSRSNSIDGPRRTLSAVAAIAANSAIPADEDGFVSDSDTDDDSSFSRGVRDVGLDVDRSSSLRAAAAEAAWQTLGVVDDSSCDAHSERLVDVSPSAKLSGGVTAAPVSVVEADGDACPVEPATTA